MSRQSSTKQLAIRLKAVCLALVCVLNVCAVHEALAQWTERTSSGSNAWSSIASSSDGTKLVAAVDGGGATSTPRLIAARIGQIKQIRSTGSRGVSLHQATGRS